MWRTVLRPSQAPLPSTSMTELQWPLRPIRLAVAPPAGVLVYVLLERVQGVAPLDAEDLDGRLPKAPHEPACSELEELEVRLGGLVFDGNAVLKVPRGDGADVQDRRRGQKADPPASN